MTQQCLERVASLPAAKECVSYKDFLQPLNALSRNGVSLQRTGACHSEGRDAETKQQETDKGKQQDIEAKEGE